jgi:MoaA/NifB/PqqE/SkfB family radical SAM enzyme
MDKNFNEETFCVAPWVSTHLSTFGNIIPCCLYKQEDDQVFGQLKQGIPIKEAYNSEVAKSVRKALWNGEKIDACQICWYREEVSKGKSITDSYRYNLNNHFMKYIDDIVANTNDDFSLKEVNFKMIDLRFDNKCNLKCRICNPSYSSSLYKEYKELGFTNFKDLGQPYSQSIDSDDYEFILSQLHNVDVLFFAGGEPLTQDKHYEILQYCIDKGYAKNISIWITTNLTKIQYKNYNLVEMWKHFKRIEVTASIDGYGQRGEYLRNGSKWTQVVQNRIDILRELPDIYFAIVPTINIMNSYTIIDLYKEFVTAGYIKTGHMHVNLLTHPAHMQIRNLPENHKVILREKYAKIMDWIRETYPYDNEAQKDIEQFEFILGLMNQDRSEEEFQHFLKMTDVVDTYRGDDFFGVFTEFQDFNPNQEVKPVTNLI